MYNKNLDKMNKEQLRMQMLAGIITESQYKEKMEEAINLNQIATNLADKFGVDPEVVDPKRINKIIDLIDETQTNEAVESTGPEAIFGAIAIAGAIAGAIGGYMKWETNANLRSYVKAKAEKIVDDKLAEMKLTRETANQKDIEILTAEVIKALRKDPGFMKMAKAESR